MPEVTYAEAPDRACAATRGYEIKDEWIGELNRVLPVFRALWIARGREMFAAVESLTQRPVDAFLAPVRLTLCDTPSQSFDGPSVNMRYALRSFTPTPVPLRYKVDVAFHETLHAFVAKYVPRNSRLLAPRSSETTCVLNHLHLLALQKAVLLSMDAREELEQLIAIDSALPSDCYRRAWSLVNETEDSYKQFVAELAREK